MKRIVFGLLALTALVFVGCEKDDGGNLSIFEGEWAIVADYENEDGWDYYYDGSDIYVKISSDGVCYVYEADDWDGYPFSKGYFECSRDDFKPYCSFRFTIDGAKGYCEPNNEWEVTDMYIEDGKLYLRDGNDSNGYCEMYERVKGFKED